MEIFEDKIREIMLKTGSVACGVIKFEKIADKMSQEAISKTYSICENPKSVICTLFSYYTEGNGNICKYARGYDYHNSIKNRLNEAVYQLEKLYEGRKFVALSDNSPLPEVYAAWQAGCGQLGMNGLIICPPYGSYVFIGTILTDLEVEQNSEQPLSCIGCGACVKACPTSALSIVDGKPCLDTEKCVSNISQKKGELSEKELAILEKSPLIWGCDCCLDACPLNKKAQASTLPEFTENLIFSLSQDDIDGISNREFKEKFANRAFTWRGKSPLERNLKMKK